MESRGGQPIEPVDGVLSLSWFDAEAEREWANLVRRHRLLAWLAPLFAIPGALLAPPIVGLAVGLCGASIAFLIRTKRLNRGFDDGANSAVVEITEKRLTIRRPGQTLLDCEADDVIGFRYRATKRPTLTAFLSSGSEVEIGVFPPETHSRGFWATIEHLEASLPIGSRREYVDGQELPTFTEAKREAKWLLLWGASLLALAALIGYVAFSIYGALSTDAWGMFVMLSVIVGVSLLVCSWIVYARGRRQNRRRKPLPVPGTELARFDPSTVAISHKRAGIGLGVLLGSAWFFVGFVEWPNTWFFIPLSLVPMSFAACQWHLARIENTTVVVTDQYVAVSRGKRIVRLRHGHYGYFPGSVFLGRRIRHPKHGIVLVTKQGTVNTTNRSGANGILRVLLDRLADDAEALAQSMDL